MSSKGKSPKAPKAHDDHDHGDAFEKARESLQALVDTFPLCSHHRRLTLVQALAESIVLDSMDEDQDMGTQLAVVIKTLGDAVLGIAECADEIQVAAGSTHEAPALDQ